jgi:hypothetical protein
MEAEVRAAQGGPAAAAASSPPMLSTKPAHVMGVDDAARRAWLERTLREVQRGEGEQRDAAVAQVAAWGVDEGGMEAMVDAEAVRALLAAAVDDCSAAGDVLVQWLHRSARVRRRATQGGVWDAVSEVLRRGRGSAWALDAVKVLSAQSASADAECEEALASGALSRVVERVARAEPGRRDALQALARASGACRRRLAELDFGEGTEERRLVRQVLEEAEREEEGEGLGGLEGSDGKVSRTFSERVALVWAAGGDRWRQVGYVLFAAVGVLLVLSRAMLDVWVLSVRWGWWGCRLRGARGLAHLSTQGADKVALMGVAGATSALVELLRVEEARGERTAEEVGEARRSAAEVLGNMCKSNEALQAQVLREGGAERLVRLLQDGDPAGRAEAAQALRHLAWQNADARRAVLRCEGVVRALVWLVEEGAARGKETACACLLNLAWDEPAVKRQLLACDGVRAVVHVLREGCDAERAEAAGLLQVLADQHQESDEGAEESGKDGGKDEGKRRQLDEGHGKSDKSDEELHRQKEHRQKDHRRKDHADKAHTDKAHADKVPLGPAVAEAFRALGVLGVLVRNLSDTPAPPAAAASLAAQSMWASILPSSYLSTPPSSTSPSSPPLRSRAQAALAIGAVARLDAGLARAAVEDLGAVEALCACAREAATAGAAQDAARDEIRAHVVLALMQLLCGADAAVAAAAADRLVRCGGVRDVVRALNEGDERAKTPAAWCLAAVAAAPAGAHAVRDAGGLRALAKRAETGDRAAAAAAAALQDE